MALTAALVDIPSVSGAEAVIADSVAAALATIPALRVVRDGDALVASTEFGATNRLILAGHIDTVPIADNVPSRIVGDRMYGCGTTDMKSGVAVQLWLAGQLTDRRPLHDVTFVFYDNEEVAAEYNGLLRLSRTHPDLLTGDLAILLEPTGGVVEAGCQGTLRATVRVPGRRAHSARSWLGENAIHDAGPVLARLADYQARQVEIDGCRYREGLNAVAIVGGVAGNVIPDECLVTVNYRFAPDRTVDEAVQHVVEVFKGFEVTVTDNAPGALPGLSAPAAAEFIAALDAPVRAKYGWTDVARFSELGIPAVNFGPGEPSLAHTRDEYVETAAVRDAAKRLDGYLFGSPPS